MSGNVIAVIGTDAVLVFDTGHHPPVTRSIIAELKRITDKPVRYLVVSHWHDDHWVGSAEFADAYPGVQVIAHEFTAKLMEERKDKFRGESCKADLAKDPDPLREQLASGKTRDGAPLPEDTKARMTQFQVDISPFSAKFSQGDAFIKANFDYMMGQPAINRVWQELAGKWEPEGG